MADRHVITGLQRERTKMLAEITRLEATIAAHRADLLHIEAAIAICLGKPVSAPQERKRLFQRGQVGQVVFAALRRSERPLSTAEIVALLATDDPKRAIKSVGKSLAKFRQKGHVHGDRKGNMTWWRLPE